MQTPRPAPAWPWAPPQEGNELAGWRVGISALGAAEGSRCAAVEGPAKVEAKQGDEAIGGDRWLNLVFDFDKLC